MSEISSKSFLSGLTDYDQHHRKDVFCYSLDQRITKQHGPPPLSNYKEPQKALLTYRLHDHRVDFVGGELQLVTRETAKEKWEASIQGVIPLYYANLLGGCAIVNFVFFMNIQWDSTYRTWHKWTPCTNTESYLLGIIVCLSAHILLHMLITDKDFVETSRNFRKSSERVTPF